MNISIHFIIFFQYPSGLSATLLGCVNTTFADSWPRKLITPSGQAWLLINTWEIHIVWATIQEWFAFAFFWDICSISQFRLLAFKISWQSSYLGPALFSFSRSAKVKLFAVSITNSFPYLHWSKGGHHTGPLPLSAKRHKSITYCNFASPHCAPMTHPKLGSLWFPQ